MVLLSHGPDYALNILQLVILIMSIPVSFVQVELFNKITQKLNGIQVRIGFHK